MSTTDQAASTASPAAEPKAAEIVDTSSQVSQPADVDARAESIASKPAAATPTTTAASTLTAETIDQTNETAETDKSASNDDTNEPKNEAPKPSPGGQLVAYDSSSGSGTSSEEGEISSSEEKRPKRRERRRRGRSRSRSPPSPREKQTTKRGDSRRESTKRGYAPQTTPKVSPKPTKPTIPPPNVYLPPHLRAKLLQMETTYSKELANTSAALQRTTWEALKKTIHGTINRLNPSTLKPLISGLLQANLLRGRGILAKTLLKAGTASPSYTPVYAALVAVISSKLPEIGELVLTRMIVQFRRCYSRSDKGGALGMALFLGQLMNQGVAHELLGLQLVTLLLEDVDTDVGVRKGGGDGVSADGVEIVVAFMRIVGVLWSG